MIDRTTNIRRLEEFRNTIGEHIAAMQTAARDVFGDAGDANQARPRGIRVEVRASLDDPQVLKATGGMPGVLTPGVECYTHTYVGGHLADGTPYYVIETVCIEGVLGIGET